jgi:sialate O-acetylesterase
MAMNGIVTFGVLVFLAGSPARMFADDLKLLHSLEGQWKIELGDNPAWAAADFDDRTWAKIDVPSAWEDQGFPGYDGYAWYRVKFEVPSEWKEETLFLRLGHIDDVDEVYVNGRFVGFQGSFPPGYVTAYDVPREYYLPWQYLKPGRDNVLAVRVYDNELTGGIVHAGYQRFIGIYSDPTMIIPDHSLIGEWKFMPGDRQEWANPDYDDNAWHAAFVPAYWETQGFRGLDGFAWYRTSFRVPPKLAGQTLILLLGKIDDADQAYLNGTLIGKTGIMPPGQFRIGSDDYQNLRAYTMPASALSLNGENTLAIRVFDGFLHGGIYSVPIGITTRERYLDWSKKKGPGERHYWFDWLNALLGR